MSSNIFNLIDYKSHKNYPYPTSIKGNCTIKNYKGKNKKNVENPFIITKRDNQVSVKGLAEQKFKDIHTSLNVFAKIAAIDGNPKELSAEDLKLARQDFGLNKSVWENLGVTSFRYDPNENLANIQIGSQLLSIDFETDTKPKANTSDKNSKKTDNSTHSQTSQNTPEHKVEHTTTQTATSVSKQNRIKSVYKKTSVKTTSSNTLDKYAGIPKKWIPHIKNTAKKWRYSEELIISIAISEGYTPTAEHKDEGGKGGLWEVGFG